MAALVPLVSASRPESTWKGAPKFAWPTKLKSTALRVAGASGGGVVCAIAPAVPADQSRAQVKPKPAIRFVADARFISEISILPVASEHSWSACDLDGDPPRTV